MSNAKHTPGPWETDVYGVITGGPEMATSITELPVIKWMNKCKLSHAWQDIDNRNMVLEHQANARLIAAAPELLEALIQARAAMPDRAFATADAKLVIDMVNAAIAKAEGE
jgi:hypothetical protein